jgi:CheY-like chemotaxis protein
MTTLPSVLLVDDDRTTNFLHERLLRRLAVAEQLVAVTNGAQALAYFTSLEGAAEQPYPALILLDLRMAVLDGWDFLTAYRQLPLRQRQAPVIVLAVPLLSVAELEVLQRLPVASVLYKPLTTEKVEQMLALLPVPDLPISEKER